MPKTRPLRFIWMALLCLFVIWNGFALAAQPKKALTFQDVMKFKAIQDPAISENGLWIAYTAQPDRGEGEVRIQSTRNEKKFIIARGSKPVFSKDSLWLASMVKPKAVEMEKAKKDKPKQGMALLEIETGKIVSFESVEKFAFSDDSVWLAYHLFQEEEKAEQKDKLIEGSPARETGETKKEKKGVAGSSLILRHLSSGNETQIPSVLSFAFDSSSGFLAYAVSDAEGKSNGLYYRELKQEGCPEKIIAKTEKRSYTNLTWAKEESKLAFLDGIQVEKDEAGEAFLWLWDRIEAKAKQVVGAASLPQDWTIPQKNQLTWTRDGKRLFFGLKPKDMTGMNKEKEVKKETPSEKGEEKEKEEARDLFDLNKILEKKEMDVWHWNDPLIIPQQKKQWLQIKDKTYTAVYHLDRNLMVPLASQEMPEVQPSENPSFALGLTDVPYLKEITWDGHYNDVYLIDLIKGLRKKIVSRLEARPFLSPNGKFIAYYHERHWYLFDCKTGVVRNLTKDLKIAFDDEDYDNPGSPPPYGLMGWMKDDSAALIYDRFDIWQFPTNAGPPLNITAKEGRKTNKSFRLLRIDPEERFFERNQRLLLSSYHNLEKNGGFFTCRAGSSGVEKKLEEKKRFRFLAKAKNADILIYTRESYEEFPDIWISDLNFASPRKITDVNPQVDEYAWGSAELVNWRSDDGLALQGVLIKPENFEPGMRYPLIVYFYELSSQRLYEFNQIVVNHRPCFPVYASHGYAIFLPDIRFEAGRPGLSAVKCLVPGIQKLIDMEVADPKAIGLHGHSWGGYQTAFVVTQTNIFTAAIAGAPVANMTSAYSGIRWESGLARQFQYEKDQSRIGGSLWEYPERFIENSPVFFADRIKTPLLLMFGDEDGAVPWYQGIELYLAMRRLGKDCIFLQYRGEPHHPQKYPNKLDYAIKMMQYFDHYLKGEPAADWIKQGIPYNGK